jgi:peptidoglycan/xylan/chitin deacetylase (PgdA/CDA1 family)
MRSLRLLFLRAARSIGAFAAARYVTRRQLRILCYHGFELRDETKFRPQLFMSGATFESRIAAVALLGYRVVPLDEAIDRLKAGTLTGDEVVITTDDGWHSFAQVALPVLARYGLPSTLYVTTYYVTHNAPVFRLAVQYLFWRAARRPVVLRDMPWLKGGVHELDMRDPVERECAESLCYEYGERNCNESERQDLCRELGRQLGVDYDDIVRRRILHLMSPAELKFAARQGVDIQLHTHRHRFPADDLSACALEIAENRAVLETVIGQVPRHFCYPSGDWHPVHWSVLQSQGVRSATTCEPGLNEAGGAPYAMRRILDGEHLDPIEFEAALSGFLSLARQVAGRMRRPARDA